MAGFAYWLLERALIARHGADSVLATAIGNDFKGNLSLFLYCRAPRPDDASLCEF